MTAGAAAAAVAIGVGVALSACETAGRDQPGGGETPPRPQRPADGTSPPPGGGAGEQSSNGTRQRRPVTEYSGELRSSTELQAALFGYADTYIAVTSEAADKLIGAASTPERRVQAIRMKLDGASDVVKIVTGPNPTVSLMDLAVMVTVQHQVWDEYWATEVFTGPEAEAYSSAMRRMDREIWRIVGQSIPQNDVTALQELAANMRRWYRRQVYVTSIRASAASQDINEQQGFKTTPSLLSLFGVDPLAGISPAVAEVTKTRLLAERALYFSQKLATLVQWRSELALAETMAMPEAQKALANMDATVESIVKVADTVDALPNVIADNRAKIVSQTEQAIDGQVTRIEDLMERERTAWLDGIAREREAMQAAFDERHVEAKAVLAELRTTIEAADKLSASVKGVLVEVKALSGDGKDAGPADPPARPFDIREYQQTIESATGSLKELNAAVQSAKELVDSPKWQERERAIRELTNDVGRIGTRLVVYASIGLGLALFLGISGAFIVRSWMARRVRVVHETAVR